MSTAEAIGQRGRVAPASYKNRKAKPRRLDVFPDVAARAPHPSKGKRYDPHLYAVEDVAALMRAAVAFSKFDGWRARLAGERNRAMIAVLYRSGLRVGEFCDLEERDLLRDEGFIVVRCGGKSHRRREVPMDKFGWQQMDRWMALRGQLPHGKVFCAVLPDHEGQAITTDNVRDILHRLGRKAGLRRRCTPHNFRHSFAVELLLEGVDLKTISLVLGHVDLRVTEIYFRGLPQRQLIAPLVHRAPPMLTLTTTL